MSNLPLSRRNNSVEEPPVLLGLFRVQSNNDLASRPCRKCSNIGERLRLSSFWENGVRCRSRDKEDITLTKPFIIWRFSCDEVHPCGAMPGNPNNLDLTIGKAVFLPVFPSFRF